MSICVNFHKLLLYYDKDRKKKVPFIEFKTDVPIALASGSPRMQRLLKDIGIPFETMLSSVEEVVEWTVGDFEEYAPEACDK